MYIQSLQSLRGIFALFIFFHHFSFSGEGVGVFLAGGDCGVSFFFILSGFVLSVAYLGRNSVSFGVPVSKTETSKKAPKSIGHFGTFMIKRFSKIYPLHILCLFLAIALKGFEITLPDVANALLLQAWVPLSEWYFSGNSVGWCLSDFLFFYALFPLLAHSYNRYRRYFVWVFCVIVVLYGLLIVPFIPNRLVDGIIYICPLTRLLDFVLGMVLFGLCNCHTVNPFKVYAVGLLSLLVLGVTLFMYYMMPSRYGLSLLWWPSMALIIFYGAKSNSKILTNKVLVWFGDISFSFYMVHVLVIKYFNLFTLKIGMSFSPFMRMLTVLVLAIVVAFVLHRYFVLPVERLIRKKLCDRRSRL
ncbi:MAG: acyltransferase [Muribaculaceae bacterium]|nr:acyltransferase [Muribaculaceae bacterium]